MGRVLTGFATARIAALVTAGMLVLAGCTGANADPTPSGSAASSGSQTPSSSPTSPSTATATSPGGTATVTVPAAARAHTDQGAKAFAVFYTKEMDKATVTADSSNLRSLSDSKCAACQGVIEIVEGYRQRGEHQDRESMTVRASEVTSADRAKVVVDVLADDGPHQVLRRDGSVLSRSEGAKINFRHTVSWTPSGWRIADSEIVQ